ncbi:MAG: putative GNAT family N-acyltransferase [Roseivirga sp.]|jgi:predicted GNAT family N-acyltransferase
MITYKRAKTDEELQQILKLQQSNFSSSISEEEKTKEGFVTVQHDFDILKSMNEKCQHIIAIHDHKVIGYALSMVKELQEKIEVLKPMFQEIEKHLENQSSYLVMGQICVDKEFRKKGVFRGMYAFMRQELHQQYDLLITEIDSSNKRSIDAHYAVGFKQLHTYYANNQDWEIVVWDWA